MLIGNIALELPLRAVDGIAVSAYNLLNDYHDVFKDRWRVIETQVPM
jgi:hypothetical protein